MKLPVLYSFSPYLNAHKVKRHWGVACTIEMEPNAFPRPPPFTWDNVELRDPLPVYPPPEPLQLPALPSPSRKPAFDAPYTLTTHMFPASYLRTTRLAPEPKPVPANLPKAERQRLLLASRLHLDVLRTSKVTDGYPRVLWNCVNRYVKSDLESGKSKKTGITLFFAHANGFPKEVCSSCCSPFLSNTEYLFVFQMVDIRTYFKLSSFFTRRQGNRRGLGLGVCAAR